MTTTSPPTPPTVDEPATARRRPRRRTVLIALAGFVLVALLATWLIVFSPVFGVRNVEVHGVRTLSAEQVRKAADIGDGTPLLRVDTAAATRRVEALPQVASAQVSTSFPSTVVITVRERQPVGYVRHDGQVVLVDGTGARYRTSAHAPDGLPRFVLPSATGKKSGAARAVAHVAAALPAAVREQIRSIQAMDPQAITLVLTHDRLVHWGSAERTKEKARILPALLDQGADQIDVTNPDLPFTR